MAILSKGFKPGNFEWHNSLKVSFTNIWGLPSNFVDCKSFLESNSPDIIAHCETNLDDSIDSGDLSVKVYFLLIQKDSTNPYAWFCCLCEGSTSFHAGIISGKLCRFLLLLSTGFTSLSVLPLFYLLITLIFMQFFDSISSNIDQILLINPSANVVGF